MKKVKLKIAVVVDAKGRWSAVGWSGTKESFEHRLSTARDGVPYDPDEDPHLPTTEYIVEAEVEAPDAAPKRIRGGAYPASA